MHAQCTDDVVEVFDRLLDGKKKIQYSWISGAKSSTDKSLLHSTKLHCYHAEIYLGQNNEWLKRISEFRQWFPRDN